MIDFEIKETTIAIDMKQEVLAGICKAPGNKIFIAGGIIKNTYLYTTYLIDSQSKSIECLPPSNQRCDACASYY